MIPPTSPGRLFRWIYVAPIQPAVLSYPEAPVYPRQRCTPPCSWLVQPTCKFWPSGSRQPSPGGLYHAASYCHHDGSCLYSDSSGVATTTLCNAELENPLIRRRGER